MNEGVECEFGNKERKKAISTEWNQKHFERKWPDVDINERKSHTGQQYKILLSKKKGSVIHKSKNRPAINDYFQCQLIHQVLHRFIVFTRLFQRTGFNRLSPR